MILLESEYFDARLELLYKLHAEVICDDELERWPDLYTDECVYKLTPRTNYERNLPHGGIFCESRGALIDRVTAIRNTLVYAPRFVSHTITGIRIVAREGNLLRSRSMFTAYQTLVDGNTALQFVGRTFDKVDTSGSEWKFAERIVVYDTDLVFRSVVHPI